MPLRKSEEFLNFFWYLAETDDSERTEAVIGIIKALKSINEDQDNKNLRYTIERLVRGLTSERKCARLGFSTALTVVLKSFEDISIEEVLEFGDKHLKPTEKHEKRNCVIGQVLLYASIIRSNRQLSDDRLGFICKKLLHIGRTKFYLEVFVSTVLIDLFERIGEKEFTDVVFPVFQVTLSCGWEKSTPFNVWLIFLTSRLYQNVINKSFLKENWGHKVLMKPDNFDYLAQIMMKSTSARPKMHSVCVEILRAAKKSKHFEHFWIKVVDNTLIPCGKDKIYLTFELIKLVLPQLKTADEVKFVLSPKFIRQFIQNLSYEKLQLYSAAQNFAEFITTFVSSHEDSSIQSTIVQLLLTRPGTISFDKITKTKTISSLLTQLKTEALDDITKFFMDYISGGLIDGVDADIHRENAAKQLENLFKHKSLVKNWDWKKRVICFFVKSAFFDSHEADKATENRISPQLHSYLSICLLRIFGQITTQTFNYWKPNIQDLFSTYYEAIKLCNNLFKDSTKATPVTVFDGEVNKYWKGLWESVNQLRESDDVNNSKPSINCIFEIIYLQLMLQLLANPKDIIPFIEEVEMCYENAQQGSHKDENEPNWVQVLIDITLSFVSKPEQKTFQCMIETIIHLLAPRITVKAVKQILNVISPHEEADILVDEDEDDESDDEVETNENDNDASSEESSSSEEDDDRIKRSSDPNEKNFENALKAAFEEDSEESDIDLDQVDQAELERKDEIFAELLRTKKKNNIENENSLRNFKLRCINLLQVIVDVHPTIPVISSMIVPILEVIVEFGYKNQESRVLHLRAETFLQRLVNQKIFNEPVDINEKPDFLAIWRQIVEMAEKVTNLLITRDLADGITLLTRCMKKSTGDDSVFMNELVANYKVLLKRYFMERNSHIHLSFISSFLDKNLDLAGDFLIDVIDCTAVDDVRLFKKTQGLGLVFSIMNHPEVLKNWESDKWELFYSKLDDCVRKSITNMGTEMKPTFSNNLFKVYWSFYQQYQKIVKKPLPVISEDLTKPIYHILRKDVKRIIRKLNQLNSSSGEMEAEMSPKKKSKKRKREEKHEEEALETVQREAIEENEKTSPKKKRKNSIKSTKVEEIENDKTFEVETPKVITEENTELEKSTPKRSKNSIEENLTEKKRKNSIKSTKVEEIENDKTIVLETPEVIAEENIELEKSFKRRKNSIEKKSPKKKRKNSIKSITEEKIENDQTLELKTPENSPEKKSPKKKRKNSLKPIPAEEIENDETFKLETPEILNEKSIEENDETLKLETPEILNEKSIEEISKPIETLRKRRKNLLMEQLQKVKSNLSPEQPKKLRWAIGKTEISYILGPNCSNQETCDETNNTPQLRSRKSLESNTIQNGMEESINKTHNQNDVDEFETASDSSIMIIDTRKRKSSITRTEEKEMTNEKKITKSKLKEKTPIETNERPSRLRQLKLNIEEVSSSVTLNDIYSPQTNGFLPKRRILRKPTVSESSQGSESVRRSARIQNKNKV